MVPKLKEAGWEKYAEFKIWFDQRLDAAIKKVKTLSLVNLSVLVIFSLWVYREGTGAQNFKHVIMSELQSSKYAKWLKKILKEESLVTTD
jgi:hypothetical protein